MPHHTCLHLYLLRSTLYVVSIRGSTHASAYIDPARAVSFDLTMLNLVAIRPHIVTQCL